MRTWLFITLVFVFTTAVVPAANPETSPNSFEAHTDLPAYAVILLPVDREDVAPYVPAGFRIVEVDGETAISLEVALFENTSFDFENGASQEDSARFPYSALALGTYGPEGSGFDSGGVLYSWRLAGAPIFPAAMAHLGVHCGGGEPTQSRICHVTELTVEMETSATEISVHANVPWGFSPYSVSASFVPTTLPCGVCLPPLSGWHAGSRGIVREDVVFSEFPDSAMIGVGSGTVRAVPGSPLFHILGGQGEARGLAILLRVHIDAAFTLQ
jgi:hypothetical protein